ncbi:MAG TPA: transposase [Roseiflexaceae bacterium]|nr:transposase [Roseiflexaceae bacterium]
MTMGTRKTYTNEFKQDAIKLVTEHGLTRKQVARDLGIDPQTLRSWLRAAEGSPAATPASDTAELARLRRENDQLRMERAMLKKALGICSRMPQ